MDLYITLGIIGGLAVIGNLDKLGKALKSLWQV